MSYSESVLNDLINRPPDSWEIVFSNSHADICHALSIVDRLERVNKHLILPKAIDIFNAFRLCKLQDVKVVILAAEPYNTVCNIKGELKYISNGLAYSVHDDCTITPMLKNIYQSIKYDYPQAILDTGNLTQWAKQGVLLLHCSMTTSYGKENIKSHGAIWNGFLSHILIHINEVNPECIYALWGQDVQKHKAKILAHEDNKLTAGSPSGYTSYLDSKAFITSRHFKTINKMLINQNKSPINWNLSRDNEEEVDVSQLLDLEI